jgi:hypothetical protein
MYTTITGLILGFHGCDKSLQKDILLGKDSLKPSKNRYDWLGNGIYFWDNSPSRAIEYANALKANPGRANKPIKEPAVLGAVLDLGFCLDLLDYDNLKILSTAYDLLIPPRMGPLSALPQNKSGGSEEDLLYRELDCSVIQRLHQLRLNRGLRPYDSVRGVFWEGKLLYPDAGFREKNHIQICICNPSCIKGYFHPLKEDKTAPHV